MSIQPRPEPGHRIRFVAIVALFATLPFCCTPAPAQTAHEGGHAKYHDFYQHWMMPHAPNVSCCRAKENALGALSGDCYATAAELRPSQREELKGAVVWWAMRDNGVWIEVPENRYIREQNPDESGRDAHLCEVGGLVFCFRPPVGSF